MRRSVKAQFPEKNLGSFLAEFVGGVPWAHLDIAGTAYADKELPCAPRGATGYGVRLLTQFLRDLAGEV